jgi:peptide-methionine (R)-S-oxide reductase
MDKQTLLVFILSLLIAGAFLKIYRAYKAWKKIPIEKSNEEWRRTLTAEQYHVLREGGTEAPFSSPLLHEVSQGTYVCAACQTPLFLSKYKYDSGTGWPSFSKAIDAHISIKIDHSLSEIRTEYHCSRCGSHQGHVFDDGPLPKGLRYCNNGVALSFLPGEPHDPAL